MIEELEQIMDTLVERDNQGKPLKADDRISAAVYMLHKLIMYYVHIGAQESKSNPAPVNANNTNDNPF